METKNVENELLALEKRYWQAVKDKDIDTAMSMTEDPCVVAGPQGVAEVDRKRFKTIMRGASYTLNQYDLADPHVRMLGKDTAVVAYKIREDLTVDGKPVKLEAADASVWVRNDGRWVCALHTESILGDQYGRGVKTGK